MNLRALIVWVLVSVVVWAVIVLLVNAALATDMRYCALWSREYVRIRVLTSPDVDVRTADEGYLRFMLDRAYSRCLRTEADAITLPDVPESTDEAWARAVREIMSDELGSEPAGEKRTEEWIEQCRKDYRTFDESDGTVIRRGSRGKRVPCPHKPEESDPS